MRQVEELRLIARVARLYYLENATQSAIAQALKLSQATVSRLIKRGRDEGVVRISVHAPNGTYPELEDALIARYGLKDAIVADCAADHEASITAAIGAAAAHYLETSLQPDDVIGISSWSQTLLRMVESLHPRRPVKARQVVQTLGGMGQPGMDVHATLLTTRLARILSAEAMLLPAPGLAGSQTARLALLADRYVGSAFDAFADISVAVMGVGAVQPSELLARSGNVFTRAELDDLNRRGAVGEISLRFVDAAGAPVHAPLDDRVIGISLDQLQRVARVVLAAGSSRKVAALEAALRGGYAQVLVTDRFTAQKIVGAD